MKVFEVAAKVSESREYILGSRETGSHACYLIYGVLAPGEKGRALSPGEGHEEIVLALSGSLVCNGAFRGPLEQGKALHLRGEERVSVDNEGTEPAVYVIAGGHSGHGHH